MPHWACSLLAVVLLWINAALTAGVPIPIAGHQALGFSDLDGALIALLAARSSSRIERHYRSGVAVEKIHSRYWTELAIAEKPCHRHPAKNILQNPGIMIGNPE